MRAAFFLESGLVALEGTLIGAALVTSYQLVAFSDVFGDAGTSFSVPWTQLVLLLTGVLAASLLARGHNNQKIAEDLVVSVGTVKNHVQRMISKLGVSDRTQAVVLAFETGVVRPLVR